MLQTWFSAILCDRGQNKAFNNFFQNYLYLGYSDNGFYGFSSKWSHFLNLDMLYKDTSVDGYYLQERDKR